LSLLLIPPPPPPTLFPYTTLFRSSLRRRAKRWDSATVCASTRFPTIRTTRKSSHAFGSRDLLSICCVRTATSDSPRLAWNRMPRSEEHTSELQSRGHLVCRLLLDK